MNYVSTPHYYIMQWNLQAFKLELKQPTNLRAMLIIHFFN